MGGRQWRHDDEFAGGQGVLSLFTSNSVSLQYLNTGYGYGVLTRQRNVKLVRDGVFLREWRVCRAFLVFTFELSVFL